jgi:uncharacterized protein involved in tolerance to divalent cations
MNFGTVQFKSFDKVEKLITKINFNHPYLLPYLNQIKISNTQKQILIYTIWFRSFSFV